MKMNKADAPSKQRWDAENTRIFTVKLFRKSENDVIEFLEGKNKRNVICEAIREYIANHPGKEDKK